MNLCDFGLGNYFLETTAKGQAIPPRKEINLTSSILRTFVLQRTSSKSEKTAGGIDQDGRVGRSELTSPNKHIKHTSTYGTILIETGN